MKLYRTKKGAVAVEGPKAVRVDGDWDALFNRKDLGAFLARALRNGAPVRFDPGRAALLPPVGSQEVWAAGVTYLRSRAARQDESRKAGGGDFYARVYDAPRPEIFFKATPHRVVGHRQKVRIRSDSKWNVPEPELALAINSAGKVFGYTVCNDMSSRDIEGENPLYLPQAKVYVGCCAVGPCLWVSDEPPPRETAIRLEIRRKGKPIFEGATSLLRFKRTFGELVEYLLRDNRFPAGCLYSTGTGIVPPDDFTLARADEVLITIDPIGTLVNTVA
jgi:2-dehydro-3-deoxy-D-arabinonate dehydratase